MTHFRVLVSLALVSTVYGGALYPRQAIGDSCTTDAECTSNACIQGSCGELNLPNASACFEDRQCQSGFCPGPNQNPSGLIYQCRPASERPTSDGGNGNNLPPGSGCVEDSQCASGGCYPESPIESRTTCQPNNLPLSYSCTADRQCQSGFCPDARSTGFQFQCRPAEERDPNLEPPAGVCTADSQCVDDQLCVKDLVGNWRVCGGSNLPDARGCNEDRQCQSGYCPTGANGGFSFQCRPASERPAGNNGGGTPGTGPTPGTGGGNAGGNNGTPTPRPNGGGASVSGGAASPSGSAGSSSDAMSLKWEVPVVLMAGTIGAAMLVL